MPRANRQLPLTCKWRKLAQKVTGREQTGKSHQWGKQRELFVAAVVIAVVFLPANPRPDHPFLSSISLIWKISAAFCAQLKQHIPISALLACLSASD